MYFSLRSAAASSAFRHRGARHHSTSGEKLGARESVRHSSPHESLFAKVVSGHVPVDKLYEDADAIAFRDIAPVAPKHILVIPKRALGGVSELADMEHVDEEHERSLGHLMVVAARVAQQEGMHESGYRLVVNDGSQGQQSVRWLHIHVIGGRQLSWPPG
jgi:histidine triad (HIT) family protein